jgi:hypothetical protein
MDHFLIRTSAGVTNPRGQIVTIETFLTLHLHDLRVTETEQMERPADGTGVDRLPEPIQYKHMMFKYGIHDLSHSNRRQASKACRRGNSKPLEI